MQEPDEWVPDSYPITFVKDTATAIGLLGPLAATGPLSSATQVAVDTETVILRDEDGNPLPVDLEVDGPGPWRVMSIAARFADGTRRAWVLDMGYIDAAAIAHLFEGVRPFGWNANFDRFVLTRDGVDVHHWWDGMLADAVLRCGAGGSDGRRYTSLAKAARSLLGYDMEGKSDTRLSYQTVEVEPDLSPDQIKYAGIDAIVTLEVCMVLGALLREADLVSTFVRECNAQPFIQSMVRGGIPLDVESYTEIINTAQAKAHAAAERVAVATTGRELLTTLVGWHAHTFEVERPADEDLVKVGLELLHDPAKFAAFLDDIRTRRDQALTSVGELLGATRMEDLFAAEDGATFMALPFEVDNETSLRGWLSKTAPHYTAAWVLAAREEGDFAELVAADAQQVLAAAGRRRKFTKDHDLEQVLTALTTAEVADVTDTLRAVAQCLLNYRRFNRIVTTYGDHGADKPARLVPTWNVGSDVQVKEMLNTYCADLVRAYLERTSGQARLLDKADSVDADALKMIGGELCEALLEFRTNDKIVTTYGDTLLGHLHPKTGRIHSRYKQALVGTGRLASEKPNAQNFSPLAKPHMRPPLVNGKVRRVLVCADLSQAELRFVSDAAQDANMLEAFRSGQDLHERTASLMFSVDLKTLKPHEEPIDQLYGEVEGLSAYAAANPDVVVEEALVEQTDPAGNTVVVKTKLFRRAAAMYKELRQKAKKVGFGYNYGLKKVSLARGLTVDGVPTTPEEAQVLLDKFDEAYPQVAAWMKVRADFIAGLSNAMKDMNRPSGVDFTATWMLHCTHAKTHSAYAALYRTLGRTPSLREVAERLKPNVAAELEAKLGHTPSEAEVDAELTRIGELAGWALSHDHAVVLASGGKPWSFESRTAGGRRRLFQVKTKDLCMAVITQVARSRRRDYADLAAAWAESWNGRKAAEHAAAKEAGKKVRREPESVSLTKTVNGKKSPLDSKELEKVFEDRDMRTDFVGFCLASLPAGKMEQLWRLAMADRIRAMNNQYRNHPIQGGVADAMEVAFAAIDEELRRRFPTATPIQSVHDSIVVECDIEEALAVRDMVVGHMQAALASFCPSVPCVADGDIQLSLYGGSVVSEEQLADLIAEAA